MADTTRKQLLLAVHGSLQFGTSLECLGLGCLNLQRCSRRKRGKDWLACEPSRFLEEMPESELVYAGGHKEAAQIVSKGEGMDKLAKLKAMLASPCD